MLEAEIQDLTPTEKAVVGHLKKNRGVSKRNVVISLGSRGEGSNVTVLKAIKNLENIRVISVLKDKKNSYNAYKLYLKEDNVFLSIYSELGELKDAFFNLIEKLGSFPLFKEDDSEAARHYDLILIYQHILGVLITYSVLKWPNEIKDRQILNKIYGITFLRMIEMQNKMSQVFRLQKGMPDFNNATFGQTSNPILLQFIYSMFLLRPDNMIRILKDYGISSIRNRDLAREKEGTKRGIASLLEIVWKIGFPIYPYYDPYDDMSVSEDFLPKHINNLKDWKFAITNYIAKREQYSKNTFAKSGHATK